jgi:cation diffusion facilitator CzcD-associated flavoprotein CzcO
MTFDARAFVLSHAIWVVGGIIGLLGFHFWQAEHDARLTAETESRVSRQAVVELKAGVVTRDAQAKQQVEVIVRQQAAVKTPAQAVAAFPDVSQLPMAIRPAPTGPDYVLPAPDLVPLYTALADGKRCAIDLLACQGDYFDQLKINNQLQTQADDWKKAVKGTFWTRARDCAIRAGVGGTAGAIGGSKNGAIIGVGLGLSSCFLFH